MTDDKIVMFRNRLAKVFRHLGRQATRAGVSCYRLYDHDLPEFPLCIEIYGSKIYVAEYRRRHGLNEEEHETWMNSTLEVVSAITGIGPDDIFSRLRQKKAGRQGQYRKLDDRQHEFVVEENGLKFLVNLSDYLDTGLFLDHRITRQMVRELSQDKKVLNLFAYTGSFSVYAAAGGADEVVTIDLSKTYLSWAEKNFALNHFTNVISEKPSYTFFHADVKQYLKTINPGYFDIIIMDPPTFSNSKRMEDILDIGRDHPELINQCMNGLKPGGQLFFSTNYRKFVLDKEKIHAASISDITKATTPFDFAGRLFRYCYRIIK